MHFQGYLDLVEPKAVLKAHELPGKVVWHFFSIEDTRDVIRQFLNSGADVDKNLAVQAPILVVGFLAWEVLLFLFLVLCHRGPK